MERINQFSIQRFALLSQRYLMFNIKTWLIGLGAFSGILIVISLLQAYFSNGIFLLDGMATFGQVMIFTGGYVITSMAYNEIHTPARSQFFLTLPATTLEKLLSHWIITSIVFIVLANVLLTLVLLIANGIAYIAWGSVISVFNPIAGTNLKLIAIYLSTQSVFFLGALFFRKNNFLKILLSLFVIATLIIIMLVIFAFIVFGETGFQTDMQLMDSNFKYWIEETFPEIMKVVFYGIMGPFFLLISYFRLKEREV